VLGLQSLTFSPGAWIALQPNYKKNGMQYEQVNILHFQIPQNMKEIYDLQLQPFRINPWKQLYEFSQKHNITLEILLQDLKFFNNLLWGMLIG